jgi:serine/threonine protein kinase/tetratricopeptide (TPR) repeat protein
MTVRPHFDGGFVRLSLLGRQLGDFVLEKKLGAGGMGEVYRAKQVSLDRTVAVKVLPRSLATQAGFEERFRREARAAANLIHPNVMQVYHIGIDTETLAPYFAMEFVDGEDLQQRVHRLGRLPFEQSVEIMVGVASALACAFEKGIVHRDIKPSNIMIDRNDIVKVMDFGLAKATQDAGGAAASNLTQSGLIMGTPNYISPEAGKGDPTDGRTDIYSLGVAFFELLTGQLPFTANTPAAIIYKHVYEPPPKPRDLAPDIPPFLEEICLRMIEKEPKDRYPNAKALLADLNEFKRNAPHYLQGGARRTPAIGGGSMSQDSTLGASGAFAGKPGPGSRTGAQAANFRASQTSAESVLLPGQNAQTGTITPPPGEGSIIITVPGGKRATLVAGGVALVAVAALGFLIAPRLLGSRPPAPGPGQTGIPSGVRVAGQVTFPLSKLDGLLPKNVESFLLLGIEPKPLILTDVPIEPGQYTLLFRRKGFEDVKKVVAVDGSGTTPPLESLKIEMKPRDEVRRAVDDARQAIQEQRFTDAIRLLQGIIEDAPDYDAAAAAYGEAKRGRDRLNTDFQRAQTLYNQKRWTDSIAAFQALPAGFEQAAVVRAQIDSANQSIKTVKALRERLDQEVALGQFGKAGGTLADLSQLVPANDPDQKALSEKIAEAQRELDAGDAALKGGQQDEALRHFSRVLEIAPSHEDALKKAGALRAEIGKARGATQQVQDALASGEKAFQAGNFKLAAEEARRAIEADPNNAGAQDLSRRARAKVFESEIAGRLAELDDDFKTLSVGSREKKTYAILEKVDPDLARRLKPELEAFAAAPVEVHEAAHKVEAVEPTQDGAVVECTWSLTLGFPETEGAAPAARGRLTAFTVRQKVGVRRVGAGWVFTSFEEIGNANVR